ncbi:MAG: phosphoribosylanthranilate isomerase [Clostridium sp.]
MTKIKICGITTVEEVEFLNIIKPDYIGLVFAESKRKIDKHRGKEIIKRLNEKIKVVGVFKGNTLDEIKEIVRHLNLEIIQLHEYEEAPIENIEVWQAINIKNETSLAAKKYGGKIVLDSTNPGSGEGWNIDILSGIKFNEEIFIAGGINVDNVSRVLESVKPYGIDVSSGVENRINGVLKKDKELVINFIEKVRKYDKREV